MEKYCPECKELKQQSQFYTTMSEGRQRIKAICKSCTCKKYKPKGTQTVRIPKAPEDKMYKHYLAEEQQRSDALLRAMGRQMVQ